MRKVHYISFFLNQNEINGRDLSVAALSKTSYIIEAIQKAGYEIQVVSTALTRNGAGFSSKKKLQITNQENHVYLSALGSKNVLLRKLKQPYMQMQLLLYLIKYVKGNDIVLAYHSLSYMNVLKLFSCFKNNHYVLEFNDLYALHYMDQNRMTKIRKKECRYLKLPDAFLLASPYMKKLITGNKPSIISYGSYKIKPSFHQLDDGKIHVVYSGVIENMRKAAKLVANTARYLTNQYVIHIAGYGTTKCMNQIENLCKQINNSMGYRAIIFHGLLLGDELDELLDNCKIALNCHTYKEYDLWKSKFSFPSKIPLNMSHGLYLVSHDMPVIFYSKFVEFTTFFLDFTPKAVAEAIVESVDKIKSSDLNRTPKDLISEMDESFVKNIKTLFSKL